ncbi:MAG: hypothetical protein QNJ97_03160 [Myxococcota bacterium]|nr:hypothetical protein [Myxococcota bacterium]
MSLQTILKRMAQVGICLSVLCVTAPAFSEPSELDKVEAKKHFDAGLSLLKAENYTGAMVEFEASLLLYPTKNALFNLANTYKALHRYAEAYDAFVRLQREFSDQLNEEMERSVERHKQEIRNLVAELMVKVNLPGAKVRVGDKEMRITEDSGALILGPGEYTVSVTLDGYEPQSRNVKMICGAKKTEVFELEKAGAEAAVSQTPVLPNTEQLRIEPLDPSGPTLPDTPRKDNRLVQRLFWGGLAGTVVVGATTGVFWGLTASKQNEYNDLKNGFESGEIPSSDTGKKSNLHQLKEDTEAYNKVAVGLSIGTGAIAVATTVLFFMSRSSEAPKSGSGPEISAIPGGVRVRF